jgi:hypothetical protein
MAVTWKLSVNVSPGATGLADGVESTMYWSGNLVPLNVLLHAERSGGGQHRDDERGDERATSVLTDR